MNIVFDIGNVLCTFQPKVVIDSMFHDKEITSYIMSLYFPEAWNAYDEGTKSREDLKSMANEYIDECNYFMDHWFESVNPIESSMTLIDEYDGVCPMYILSNIPSDCYEYLKAQYSFMRKMSGGIYSYQEKLLKPDPKIYQTLLEKYDIMASDCVFIDDKLENIRSAESLGFRTIHCTDPSQIKEKLNEM